MVPQSMPIGSASTMMPDAHSSYSHAFDAIDFPQLDQLDREARKHVALAASALSANLKKQDTIRQNIEDTRSIRRNRNRLLTLLAALGIGLVVVYTLPMFGHMGHILAPYAFVITIVFDSSLAVYSYVKRY